MSKLSIKSSKVPAFAAIIDTAAYNLCEAVEIRDHYGRFSPTRLFYSLLFAFIAEPEWTVEMLKRIVEVGKPGLEQHYMGLNARRGPRGEATPRPGKNAGES